MRLALLSALFLIVEISAAPTSVHSWVTSHDGSPVDGRRMEDGISVPGIGLGTLLFIWIQDAFLGGLKVCG